MVDVPKPVGGDPALLAHGERWWFLQADDDRVLPK